MVSRADRSPFAEWWWTVDRLMVVAILILMVGGLVLSLAASPAIARHLDLADFHFVKRQAVYLVPALLILLGISFLNVRNARRLCLIVFLISIALMIATLFVGAEVKGSRRWISIAGISIQPSEILKPAFVVLAAWFFAEQTRRRDVPGNLFAIGLLAITVGLLVLQPDIGQTMLITLVWGAMFFLAGMPWIWIAILAGLAAAGSVAAYFFVPHVTKRIDSFLDPSTGDTYQIDRAIESFVRGGWFGRGPGEGTVKRGLPDSHTDFIFAVAAEEFGIVICLVILLVFGFVVLRGLMHALKESDAFIRLAVSGLVALLGLQAAINMAVNLQLMPAKGMTLPFLSYGGSSLLAMAFAMGLVLALTRRRTASHVYHGETSDPVSPPAARWSGA